MRVMAMAAAMGLAAGAWAQEPWTVTSPPRRVEPGTQDVGPLRTSNRLVPLDLRAPMRFEGVYEFERRDRFGRTEKWYARSDGGLTAIFPRSEYTLRNGRPLAEIPAGTVWLIGGLRPETPKPTGPRPYNWVDLSASASLRADGAAAEGSAVEASAARSAREGAERAEPPTIWTSERYRRERVGALLGSVGRGP